MGRPAESLTLPAGTRRYVAVRAGQSLTDPEQGNVGLPAVVDTASPAPGGGNGGAGPLVSPSSPGSVLGAGAGGAGGGPVGVTPAIAPLGPSLGLPSNGSCLSHRHLTVHLTPPAAETLVSARVFVNGKRVRVLRGRRLHARVDLGGLPRGAFTVKIVAHTDTGHTIRARRTYHTCAHKARRRRGTTAAAPACRPRVGRPCSPSPTRAVPGRGSRPSMGAP